MGESRMLSFGLRPENAGEGEKLHQKILMFNTARQTLQVILKEAVVQSFPFADIKQVRKSEKDECSFTFLCGGAHVYSLETENDRDDCVVVLDRLREKDLEKVQHEVGAMKIFEGDVKKKGKVKWADRWLIVVKGRVLIFRNKAAPYPINAISMSDAICKRAKALDAIVVSTLYRDYDFRFESKDRAAMWFQVIAEVASKAQALSKQKREQRVDRSDALQRLKVEKERKLALKEEERKHQREKERALYYEDSDDSGDEMDALKPRPRQDIRLEAPEEKKMFAKRRKDGRLEFLVPMNLAGQKAIFSWGVGNDYQLGNGNTSSQDAPAEQKRLATKRLVSICCAKGGRHSFGTDLKGRVWVWGTGPIGLGDKQHYSQSPYCVTALRNIKIKQVVASQFHAMCLSQKGRVYGWGMKELTGAPNHSYAPDKLPFIRQNMDLVLLSAHENHTAGISKDGRLYTWGKNGPWLGLGSRWSNAPEHAQVGCTFGQVSFGPDTKVRHVSCGEQHTAIATGRGQVLTFGVGENGRLGISETHNCDTPQLVTGQLENAIISRVACGDAHTMALDDDGNVYTWGCGRRHRLGHGNQSDIYQPKIVFSLLKTNVCRIIAGPERSFAIDENGCLIYWGMDPGLREQEHPYPNPAPRPRLAENIFGYRVYEASIGYEFAIAISQRVGPRQKKPDIAKEGARSVEELQERLAASGVSHALPDAPQIGRDFHVDQETEYYENDRQMPVVEDDPERAAIASFGIGGGGDPFMSALMGGGKQRAMQHGFGGQSDRRVSSRQNHGFDAPPPGPPPSGPPSGPPAGYDPFLDPEPPRGIRQARGSEQVPAPPPSHRMVDRPHVPLDALPGRAPSFAIGSDRQSTASNYSQYDQGHQSGGARQPWKSGPQFDAAPNGRGASGYQKSRPQYDSTPPRQQYVTQYDDAPPPPPPSYIPGDDPPPPPTMPPSGPPPPTHPPSSSTADLKIKVMQNRSAVGIIDFQPSTTLFELRGIIDYELEDLVPPNSRYTFLVGPSEVSRSDERAILASHSLPEINIRGY